MVAQNDNEHKALELRAYGKRISFHTRHHWILTWIEEQPGRSLADKVWRIVDRAYRDDYAERGAAAMGRYWQALGSQRHPSLAYDAMIAALCDAIECYNRAGLESKAEWVRDLLRGVLASKVKNAHVEAIDER